MERKLYTVPAQRKEQIKNILINALQKDKDVSFAYLHGSFTADDLPFHDIDLGIYFSGDNRLVMSQAAITLAVDLSKTTSFPVDVRVLNDAPVSFLYNVMKGELICEKNEDVRCTLMENTIREYLDIQPFLHMAAKEAFSS
jgi:uncharacterized protein